MNGYELTRQWYNFKFENMDKVTHVHSDLYFYIVDLWNRLGQKKEFGLPSSVTMECVGIKSYNTYKKVIDDLINFGFIKEVKKSINQYNSRIIALSKIDKAHNKALDKALTKPPDEALDSIIEQQTTNKEQQTILFERFWNLYDKKVDTAKCKSKFIKLSETDIDKIFQTLPEYLKSTPDKKFRKNPLTYINGKCWNDEIETKSNPLEVPEGYYRNYKGELRKIEKDEW